MMTTHCTVPNSSGDAQSGDDLTQIKGIGPVLDVRLKTAGILNFSQLANLQPNTIADLVDGLSAKRIAREKWIGQARKLVPRAISADTQACKAITRTQQHYATFTVELLLEEDNCVRRTRVRQIQTEVEETWADWNDARLIQFFVQRAGLRVARPEPAPLPESTSPLTSAYHTQTTAALSNQEIKTGLSGVLRVCDLAILLPDSDVPRNCVHTNEGFNVRLVLDLTEVPKVTNIHLDYTVTICAKNFKDMSRQIVGEGRGTFMPADTASCSTKVEITSPGIYRLEALVVLSEHGKESLPQHKLMAMRTSGLLQVF